MPPLTSLAKLTACTAMIVTGTVGVVMLATGVVSVLTVTTTEARLLRSPSASVTRKVTV